MFEQLLLDYIKLYIDITASMSWVFSICVLFISLMQSVNGARFLDTTFLLTLIGSAGASTRATVIVHLKSIYASL